MSLVIRDVEVAELPTPTALSAAPVAVRRADVRMAGGIVTHVTPPDAAPDAERTLPGNGAALLPGLHDHHIHLLALAAARESVDVGPDAVAGADEMRAALASAPVAHGWIRAVGYHESVAGDLDRHVLDRLLPGRPVRVQHRSGALWILNSAALARVRDVLDESADVEREPGGAPNGRLWRYDTRLRPALPAAPPDLTAIGRLLAGYGITGVTDATPDLDSTAVALLGRAHALGHLPQAITLLGAPDSELPEGLRRGPRKLLLRDHDLPDYDALCEVVRATHARGRAVAVHCVTRESLILTLAVLEETGVLHGDRIEHAAVVPGDVAEWLARLGVRVVTQPDFLRTRAAAYRRDVARDDLPYLYPYRSLLAAGIPVCASSDAPYGEVDPWRALATAAARPLGPGENVPAGIGLAGYLGAADAPGTAPRRIAVGAVADVVLLRTPLAAALADPTADLVAATVITGRIRYRRGATETPHD
ncbi:amidohydrolase family protein [Nocardia nova SH22a]|uniref:Amidohydrolase family protein n=1 Tax=Nocardia nova SH22a TaxID=1415166 RepID=W5TG11_9NOCA|nr:amidohydrolase family protein [Nocardia nova]AHH18104.1 amidohydrolase family protein [Nocardia nova SH22a]